MACSWAAFGALRACELGYASVGVPPEREVASVPRENGAVVAAFMRVLRDAFRTPRGPMPAGFGVGTHGR